eukprot:3248497-Pyramimonas_sp.AAC.1
MQRGRDIARRQLSIIIALGSPVPTQEGRGALAGARRASAGAAWHRKNLHRLARRSWLALAVRVKASACPWMRRPN